MALYAGTYKRDCSNRVAAGIVIGDLVFICLAVLGMAALAEVMGSLFPAFVDLPTIRIAEIAIIVVLTIVSVGGVKLVYAYPAMRVV